jgi:hypothetical protein
MVSPFVSPLGFLSISYGRLCDVRFTSVKANIDLRNVTVNSKSGDFNATSLAHIINTDTVNNLVVQAWLDRASKPYLSPPWKRGSSILCLQ